MDDLLELDVAIPDMAEVLTEVGHCIQDWLSGYFTLSIQIFTGGQEICLKLKEQQVQQVFYLIAYGGALGRAELLGTLQAAVKVHIVNHVYTCVVESIFDRLNIWTFL